VSHSHHDRGKDSARFGLIPFQSSIELDLACEIALSELSSLPSCSRVVCVEE
jgi:hypothetical protein